MGLASDLQIASAFPDTDLIEYLTGSPFIDELVEQPWKLDGEGMLEIPERPCLGLSINLDALAEFSRMDVSRLR